ncbi:MAG: SDR family NAD(P)-dependent oxidoreductase [Betaproteobacteria bacterium]
MARRLEGRIALVTGGSRGIGRACCLRLAAEGAAIAVNYRLEERAAAGVAEEIRASGGRAVPLQADVADRSQVDALVDRVQRELGPVDILVNNAGILTRGTSLTMDDDEFDRMLAVNVKGLVHLVQAVAPRMIERRSGSIVNISSLAGLGTAVPDTTPYAATKAAVVVLTKRQAFELGPHGIRVNAICPGYIKTEMLASLDDPANQARLRALNAKAMLGRVGVPDDIAHVVVFLASDEASFMTGQALAVDGGRMDFLTASA